MSVLPAVAGGRLRLSPPASDFIPGERAAIGRRHVPRVVRESQSQNGNMGNVLDWIRCLTNQVWWIILNLQILTWYCQAQSKYNRP